MRDDGGDREIGAEANHQPIQTRIFGAAFEQNARQLALA